MAVYSVSQIAGYLKETLEHVPILRDLWISGEVANLSRPASGHSYFSIRDRDASLRCVMFRSAAGAERLSPGAAVIAHGRIGFYEVRGDVQLIVDLVQPEGVGELHLKLEQLRLRLETEGLFDPSRKRPLPAYPRRVGVVTSPTGSVWHDIRNVVGRRYPLVELVLAPTPVQGESAAPGIVDAFRSLNTFENIDLIIVARGGGSLEDLWPFNDEAVAHAIYASRAPVTSAIGHETDTTIADLVADHRAPTASAAAEMAVPDRRELSRTIRLRMQMLSSLMAGVLADRSDEVRDLGARALRTRLDVDSLRLRVDDLLRGLSARVGHEMSLQAIRVDGLERRLGALSPSDTLRRGYALVQAGTDGAVVTDSAQVGAGDPLLITLARGGFDARVTAVQDSPETESRRGSG